MLNQRIWRADIYEKYGESATNDQSKVEKVLYSRAFFNVSSGAENILKTYFVFGALTKGFHKGPKLTFFQKLRQKSRKLTAF